MRGTAAATAACCCSLSRPLSTLVTKMENEEMYIQNKGERLTQHCSTHCERTCGKGKKREKDEDSRQE